MLACHTHRTFRHHYEEFLDFTAMDTAYIQRHGSGHFLWALNASYLPKSGTKTPGIGKYRSGYCSKALPGLELGLLPVIDVIIKLLFTWMRL